MQQIRSKMQVFLKKVHDRVPVLTYEAYIGIELIEEIKTIYIFALDDDGKIEGGYEVEIEAGTGVVLASAVTTSHFFEFCWTSVPVVFGSDKVREIWHQYVLPNRGVRKLTVVRKKPATR